jgi:hypothetical protein
VNQRKPTKRGVLAAVTLAAIALSAVSLPAPMTHSVAQASTFPKAADGKFHDPDGDPDLVYHWGDPRYSHEQRFQMFGATGLFALVACASFARSRNEKGRSR